ncbi:hypothetical protein FRB95_002033 [Tulasnella sp. JGI-2019a]|nr:hypothetical protein FRB95_002033 [Tulasnella sp. JGI-2019a]
MKDNVYCGKTCQTKANAEAARGSNQAPVTPARGPRTNIPRPPQPFLKPRTAYQLSFGELNGKPNYLLRSKKGMDWHNLPRDLDAICKRLQQRQKTDDVMDFSLGEDGKYYFVYKDGKNVKMETSTDLWRELNENFHSGGIRQLEFGTRGAIWGVKSYRQYEEQKEDYTQARSSNTSSSTSALGYTIVEEPFGRLPESLIDGAEDLYPGLKHYGQTDFVAIGAGGSWVMGVMGRLLFWEGVHADVIKKAVGCWQNKARILNVELSPVSQEIYFIEAKDGSVAYHVPDDWHAKMRLHLQPQHMLEHSRPDRAQTTSIPRVRRPTVCALFGRRRTPPAPRDARDTVPTATSAAPVQQRPLIQPFVEVLPRYEFHSSQASEPGSSRQAAPPEYEAAESEEFLAITDFANTVPTSGVVQTVPAERGASGSAVGNWEFVQMVIATSPATARAGPQLVDIFEVGDGCAVM